MLIATATLAMRRLLGSIAAHGHNTTITMNKAARCWNSRKSGDAGSTPYSFMISDGLKNATAGMTWIAASTDQAIGCIMKL